MATMDTATVTNPNNSYMAAYGVVTYSESTTPSNVTISASIQAWMRYAYDWDTTVQVQIGSRAVQSSGPFRLGYDPGATWVSFGSTAKDSAVINRTASSQSVKVYGRITVSPWGSSPWAETVINIPALPVPYTPYECTHVRNSDTQNTISWIRAETSSNPYRFILVERRTNGGAWVQISQIDGAASFYVDNASQANATYQYRVRAEFNGMLSSYSDSTALTFNTPAAPYKPSVSRQVDNSVLLSFTNPGTTQARTRLQRSTDTVVWTDVKTIDAANVTMATDAPGAGTFFYRVRNERDALVSAWSPHTDAVITIAPPASPTLLEPSNNSFALLGAYPTLAWMHNPLDGSAQSSAEIRYSITGTDPWVSVNVSGASSTHVLDVAFPVNTVVYWQVRTKGADLSFGAWSSSNYFYVIQAPSIDVTSPSSNAPVSDLPLEVIWTYLDQSGTQIGASVSIRQGSLVLYARQIQGDASRLSIPTSELLLDNASSYTLTVSATSSSGASTTVSLAFETSYVEPAVPIGTVVCDKDAASVSLAIYAGDEMGVPDTVDMDIYRMNADGKTVTLVQGAPSGTGANDYYPPLDQEIIYVFVANSLAGAHSRFTQPITIPSFGHAFINIGEGYRHVVKMALDMTHDESTEHGKEVFATAGGNLPLVFYGEAKTHTGSISGTVLRDKDRFGLAIGGVGIADIDGLAGWMQRSILRLPFKDVMAISATVRKSIGIPQVSAEAVISWEQVKSDGLVI